jgi:hypothetical protein
MQAKETWDRSINLSYEPKEDITTYELALIIGYFHNGFMNSRYLNHISMRTSQWNEIPDNVKRHFSINGHI